jgi:hypothetical protein
LAVCGCGRSDAGSASRRGDSDAKHALIPQCQQRPAGRSDLAPQKGSHRAFDAIGLTRSQPTAARTLERVH